MNTIPPGTEGRNWHICPTCGKEFYRSTYPSTQGKRRLFCSMACRGGGPTPRSVEERFWTNVQKSDDPNACWKWLGSLDKHGYGALSAGGRNGKHLKAHRVSWEINFGPIPDGIDVCHNCPNGDEPSCTNPKHLWLGSAVDNIHDMMAKGRQNFSGLELGRKRNR